MADISKTFLKTFSIFSLIITRNGIYAFQMSCNHSNLPITLESGNAFEFYCSSSANFESCSIERKTERGTSRCMFQFHQAWGNPSDTVFKPKELKRVGRWGCDPKSWLKSNINRIKVLEKNNEKVCHLKVESFGVDGKILSNVFFVSSLA